jgi:hypothetical protein
MSAQNTMFLLLAVGLLIRVITLIFLWHCESPLRVQ